MDLGKGRESKNVEDHSNYLNQRFNHLDSLDKILFWKAMHSGRADDSYLSNVTNPNIEPDTPPIGSGFPQDTTHSTLHPINQFLSQLLSGLMNRGR